MDVILIEIPDEVGGYGAKGAGEIGLVPTAGAVAGALHLRWNSPLPFADAEFAGGSAFGSEIAAQDCGSCLSVIQNNLQAVIGAVFHQCNRRL